MEKSFKVDRRTTLAWLGGSIAAVNVTMPASSFATAGEQAAAASAKAPGYGNDPNLLNPSIPWPRTMSVRQLELSGILADIILPPTATAPAPSAVGIPDFIDEWVSAPYPDQQRDRMLIQTGLAWLDTEASARWGKAFTDVLPAQRLELLTEISVKPEDSKSPAMLRYGFFRRFRTVAVGAYYSLEQHFEQIGYVGNKPLESFPPATADEIELINRAATKLGL